MLSQQTGESSALGLAEEAKTSNNIQQSNPNAVARIVPLSHTTVSKPLRVKFSFCVLYVPNAFIPPLLVRLCQGHNSSLYSPISAHPCIYYGA